MPFADLWPLAQQGNPQALETIFKMRNPEPSWVIKVRLHDNCLQILLEAEPTPEKPYAVALVQSFLTELQPLTIATARTVRIWGRRRGQLLADWVEDIDLAPYLQPATPSAQHPQGGTAPSAMVTDVTLPPRQSLVSDPVTTDLTATPEPVPEATEAPAAIAPTVIATAITEDTNDTDPESTDLESQELEPAAIVPDLTEGIAEDGTEDGAGDGAEDGAGEATGDVAEESAEDTVEESARDTVEDVAEDVAEAVTAVPDLESQIRESAAIATELTNIPELTDAPELTDELELRGELEPTDELEFADEADELELTDEPEFVDEPEFADEPLLTDELELTGELEPTDELEFADEADELELTDAPELTDELEFADEADELELADAPELTDAPEFADEPLLTDELELTGELEPTGELEFATNEADELEPTDELELTDELEFADEFADIPERDRLALEADLGVDPGSLLGASTELAPEPATVPEARAPMDEFDRPDPASSLPPAELTQAVELAGQALEQQSALDTPADDGERKQQDRPSTDPPVPTSGLPLAIAQPLAEAKAETERAAETEQEAEGEATEWFLRPEVVVVVLFALFVIIWQTYEAILEEVGDSDASLSSSGLARRLRTTRRTINRLKKQPDFPQWSQSRDPDAIAWVYGENGRFTPVLTPTVPSTDLPTE